MSQGTTEIERKMVELLKTLRMQQSDHMKAMEIYKEFKRLRIEIGKPPRSFDSSESIMEDLSGDGFSTVLQHVKRRDSDKRRNPLY